MASSRHRRRPWRGIICLLAFVGAGVGVVVRRTSGLRASRDQATLEARRSALMTDALQLERAIDDRTSRRVLVPLARTTLGLRVPVDSQVVLLPARSPAP